MYHKDFGLKVENFPPTQGRCYFKQQKWKLAKKEIENAQKIWDVHNCHISCLKCNTILEVSIEQQYGDLCLERDPIEGISKALSHYKYGMEKLKCSTWANIFSRPEKVRTMFCSKSRISSGFVAENDGNSCWHCQESRTMRSMSLQSVDNMKVEYIRRSIMIRLLGRIGKCHRLLGYQSDEEKALFERLSLFVIRSTYNPDLSVSDDFISKIIDKRLTGFAYTTDYATAIYELCSFFLRNMELDGRYYCKNSRISMHKLVCGLKISYVLSREVPTLHQEVSRLLSILYTSDKVPTKHGVAPSVEQWASFFHQSSVGAYFDNRLTARMRKIGGHKLMEDNTEGNLEKCVLQFFNKLPDFPIICFSVYGEDSLLPSNILPFSPTSVWLQLSRLGSDKVAIIVNIVPIESSLEDTVYRDLRLQYPRSERRNLTVFDKVASVFNSVHEAKDILVDNWQQPEPQMTEFDTWFEEMRKLDRHLSVILSDLETKWFFHLKEVLLGDPLELSHDVSNGQTPHSFRSPVVLVMDPEMQRVPWECMPFLRFQDIYRMPSVTSILSTLQRNCSTGVFHKVDPGHAYYVLNPEDNLKYHEDELLPVFETNKFLGVAGKFPRSDKLEMMLGMHGIFLFSGHASGLSDMMEDTSGGLDISSSMVLMACSSGAIELNGSYSPSGCILDYILSGSPIIASHLWPIRSFDSVEMIKSMVNYWTQNRCYMTMASSVEIARQSSELPHIEGAGFVCYGVPTVIKRKKKKKSILEDG